MRKAESKFWDRIRFKGGDRIETRETRNIPDVYYNLGGNNRTGWLELKYTSSTLPEKTGLTAGQARFLKHHADDGAFTFLLKGVGDWWYLIPGAAPIIPLFDMPFTERDLLNNAYCKAPIAKGGMLLRSKLVDCHHLGIGNLILCR